MPGVIVDTSTRPSPPLAAAPDTAQYMIVGLAERGSTTGYETATSLAELDSKCGGVTSFGFAREDARRFFATGGSLLHFARVVGLDATKASSTLPDRAGSPVSTLRLDAANEGIWGSQHMTRQVLAGSTGGSYRIQIRYDGAVVEDKDNLVTPADAVAAFALSNYVRAVALADATSPPNNQPAIDADPVAFTGGADDRAAVTTSRLTAALARFPYDLGTGAVAIPGYPADLVGPALKAHAEANRRVAGFSPAKGTSQAQAKALADTLDGADGSGCILLYPWVEADGIGSPLVDPVGVWAGLRARAHRTEGPWRVPAGAAGQAGIVTGLEVELTRAEADSLDDAKVSCFRKIKQNGQSTFRLYGYRSLSTDTTNWALLKTREIANYLVVLFENDFEDDVFVGVDSRGARAGEVETKAAARLDPLVDAGALYDLLDPKTGAILGPPYRVDAGPGVNPPSVLVKNEFDLFVGFRDSPVSALIAVHVVKAGLQAAL